MTPHDIQDSITKLARRFNRASTEETDDDVPMTPVAETSAVTVPVPTEAPRPTPRAPVSAAPAVTVPVPTEAPAPQPVPRAPVATSSNQVTLRATPWPDQSAVPTSQLVRNMVGPQRRFADAAVIPGVSPEMKLQDARQNVMDKKALRSEQNALEERLFAISCATEEKLMAPGGTNRFISKVATGQDDLKRMLDEIIKKAEDQEKLEKYIGEVKAIHARLPIVTDAVKKSALVQRSILDSLAKPRVVKRHRQVDRVQVTEVIDVDEVAERFMETTTHQAAKKAKYTVETPEDKDDESSSSQDGV